MRLIAALRLEGIASADSGIREVRGLQHAFAINPGNLCLQVTLWKYSDVRE